MAVLLIPLFVIGNLFPHSHACGTAPVDHSFRPHIHLAVGHHSHDVHHHSGHVHSIGHHCESSKDCKHDHGHLMGNSPESHDADAIYLNDSPFVLSQSFASTTSSPSGDVELFLAEIPAAMPSGWRVSRETNLPLRYGLPLYLLLAALRL
jgi:hypothetical protein